MSDEMDAMMADGLLHTVRECARHLYGENQIYPCDDVKRIVAENERLRAALHSVLEEHGYGLPPETNKYIRAALLPTAEQETK